MMTARAIMASCHAKGRPWNTRQYLSLVQPPNNSRCRHAVRIRTAAMRWAGQNPISLLRWNEGRNVRESFRTCRQACDLVGIPWPCSTSQRCLTEHPARTRTSSPHTFGSFCMTYTLMVTVWPLGMRYFPPPMIWSPSATTERVGALGSSRIASFRTATGVT